MTSEAFDLLVRARRRGTVIVESCYYFLQPARELASLGLATVLAGPLKILVQPTPQGLDYLEVLSSGRRVG